MPFGDRLFWHLASWGISRCLTGNPKDLKKLQVLEKLSIRNMALTTFLNRVSVDLKEGSGLAGLLLHIGKNANPRHRRRLIQNLGINWIVNGGRIRRLVSRHVVPQGHEHAEDIIRDPKVVEWIDAYARRMKELTEPEWMRKIEDPSSRWYKEKEEYKLLFRFAKTAPPPPSENRD